MSARYYCFTIVFTIMSLARWLQSVNDTDYWWVTVDLPETWNHVLCEMQVQKLRARLFVFTNLYIFISN